MSSTIGRFDYKIIKMRKTGDRPFDPIVILQLGRWSSADVHVPRISPHLMSDVEIDSYIAELKADLDAVGRRAKKALTRAKTETLKIVADRNSN